MPYFQHKIYRSANIVFEIKKEKNVVLVCICAKRIETVKKTYVIKYFVVLKRIRFCITFTHLSKLTKILLNFFESTYLLSKS